MMILRRYNIRVYENETPNNLRFSDSTVAFSEEEAIRNIVTNSSKFNGKLQGHPDSNWNPTYPLIFQVEETK